MVTYFKSLIAYKYLLYNLASREIKSRYKQSVLGYFWVILNPFFQMLVMSFIFSFFIKIPVFYNIPYSIFVYSGLLPWTLFHNSLSSATTSLIDNETLLKKVYFPREVIITATILAKIFDFLLASTVFVGFLIFYRVALTPFVLYLPLILIVQIFFSLGLSFILSAFNLFYRDVQYFMNLVFLIWFYLTPVIFPVELIPQKYRFLFQLNPMAVLINAERRTIFGSGDLNYISLAVATIITFLIFQLGYFIFKRLEGLFADAV